MRSSSSSLKRVFLFVVCLGVLSSGAVLAETLEGVLKKAKAKDEKFRADLKDITMVQEMTIEAPKGAQKGAPAGATPPSMSQVMKVMKKGDKVRIESVMKMPPGVPAGMSKMETTVIYDGKEIWMVAPYIGKKKMATKDSAQFSTHMNWWEMLEGKAVLTGTEKVNGRSCYVIETKKDLKEKLPFARMWIDKKLMQILKTELPETPQGKMTIVQSDFRKVKGSWEIPFKTEMFLGDKLMGTSTVKSFKIDQKHPDSLFDASKLEAPK